MRSLIEKAFFWLVGLLFWVVFFGAVLAAKYIEGM